MRLLSWPLLLLTLVACNEHEAVDGDVLTSRELVPHDAGCTARTEATNFPVKVVVLLENTGRMCLIDPPGTTASNVCQLLAPDSGIRVPGRIDAVQQFLYANIERPNLQVALVPYSLTPSVGGFQLVSSAGLPAQLEPLPRTLGSANDLQSGLDAVRQLLAADMEQTPSAVRARSRYAVVLLSSGLPSPRCSANDTRSSYASQTNPDGVWADDSPICNAPCTSNDCLPGFVPGGDRNQISQFLNLVDEIMALKQTYGLGDLRLHTRTVLNLSNVVGCGPLCADLFSPVSPPYLRDVSDYTMQLLAQRGQGTWEAPIDPQQLTLDTVDATEFTQLCPP